MMFAINRHALVLAVVLLYTASFRLAVLDRPFDYDAEGASSSQYGILARSYLRFDWHRTLGMPVLTVGQLSTAPIVFYPDHPPLIPLLIAPFYAAFGVGEWQTRLPISIVTICAIYAVYRLLAHATTRRAGVTAAAVFAASPMILYFGGMPDPIGTPLILFVLFSVLGYLRFHRNPRLSTLMPFLGAFGLAGLCDWPAYVMAPIFLVHFVATRPRAEWPWILAFAAAACGLFAGLYAYITLATHSPWTWMLPLFARHSTLTDIPQFTLMQWFGNAIALNRMLHTLALMTACGLWVAMFGFRIRRSQPGATVARLLIVWGGLCILIGNRAAYGHEFVWMFLTPGLAVSTALLIESLFRVTERYRVAPVMRISMAIAGAMFAGWTAYQMFQRLYPTTRPVPFTPMEMGEAIRAAAPDPGDLALVIGGDGGPGAQMWFYGDRALRVNVWSISEVEDRLRQNWADLLFNFDVQPWDAAASGIVFPRIWDREFAHVREYLEERYPTLTLSPALSEKFKVFSVTARTQFRPVVGFGSPSASSSGRTSSRAVSSVSFIGAPCRPRLTKLGVHVQRLGLRASATSTDCARRRKVNRSLS
jgi:hypothetical protein